MSAETVTLEIHRERPEDGDGFVYAKERCEPHPLTSLRRGVRKNWHYYEWWAEIPAPVKPKRFVVREYSGEYGPLVVYNALRSVNAAYCIPTREAAQRIADIYEETTP